MYVESLTLTDFRCYEAATTSFVLPDDPATPDALNNVTLIMGTNGAGKTSTLKAIALGVLKPIIHSLGYRPYSLVRAAAHPKAEPQSAGIKLHFRIRNQDTDVTSPEDVTLEVRVSEVDIRRRGTELEFPSVTPSPEEATSAGYLHDAKSPAYFMLGYGAARRTEYLEGAITKQTRQFHPRFQRVAGLFDESVTLQPLGTWYPKLKKVKPPPKRAVPGKKVKKGPKRVSRGKEVLTLLNRLLPETTVFTGGFQDTEALFKHNGVTLPFGALSDGYRSYIGLVTDMLYYLQEVCPKAAELTTLYGVVMIDDIDVHLHPEWQRTVVPKLAATFPRLQFIITSHSPLVVGTLHAANIRVVEGNQIREYTERVHGLTADQILTSSYFGLNSTRAPDAEAKLKQVADRVADTNDPKEALRFIRELTGVTNGVNTRKGRVKP